MNVNIYMFLEFLISIFIWSHIKFIRLKALGGLNDFNNQSENSKISKQTYFDTFRFLVCKSLNFLYCFNMRGRIDVCVYIYFYLFLKLRSNHVFVK